MEYTTVRLGGTGGLLAIGKNLQAVAELQSRLIAAQQAMERDYWKLREVETRYRLLFDASDEAVLLVRAANLRIIEANPAASARAGPDARRARRAAGRAGARGPRAVPGDAGARPRARQGAGHPRPSRPRAAALAAARLADRRPSRARLPAAVRPRPAPCSRRPERPDPVTGRGVWSTAARRVRRRSTGTASSLHANQAFLDLVQLGAKGSACWASGSGAGSGGRAPTWLRCWPTSSGTAPCGCSRLVHGELGTETEVEIRPWAASDEKPPGSSGPAPRRRPSPARGQRGDWLRTRAGFADPAGRQDPAARAGARTRSAWSSSTMSKAALELTGGNRTAAAELLGLSRQSLYAKLSRYGLDGRGDRDAEDKPQRPQVVAVSLRSAHARVRAGRPFELRARADPSRGLDPAARRPAGRQRARSSSSSRPAPTPPNSSI